MKSGTSGLYIYITNPTQLYALTRLRPRFSPRLLHHVPLLPPRALGAPRTDRPHQGRREHPPRHRRQQVRSRRRPTRLPRTGLCHLPILGQRPLLRDICPSSRQRRRGVCRPLPPDHQEGQRVPNLSRVWIDERPRAIREREGPRRPQATIEIEPAFEETKRARERV